MRIKTLGLERTRAHDPSGYPLGTSFKFDHENPVAT